MRYCDLKQLQALVEADEWDFLNELDGRAWFGEAWKFMDRLEWTNDDVKAMLLGLTEDDFQKPVSNCAICGIPGRPFIDADQYEIHWDDEERHRSDEPRMGCISISLKIALVRDLDGSWTGLVTMHSSGNK